MDDAENPGITIIERAMNINGFREIKAE